MPVFPLCFPFEVGIQPNLFHPRIVCRQATLLCIRPEHAVLYPNCDSPSLSGRSLFALLDRILSVNCPWAPCCFLLSAMPPPPNAALLPNALEQSAS